MESDTRNQLARQRTELANERTLLAYIRTALGFVIVGVPAMWWLGHPYFQALGGLAMIAGVGCLTVGIRRFMAVKTMIAHEFPRQNENACAEKSRAA
jgi:putative membrane protein